VTRRSNSDQRLSKKPVNKPAKGTPVAMRARACRRVKLFPGTTIRIPRPGEFVERTWFSHIAGLQVDRCRVLRVRSVRGLLLDLEASWGVVRNVRHAHTFCNWGVWQHARPWKEWQTFRKEQTRLYREDWKRERESEAYKREQAEYDAAAGTL